MNAMNIILLVLLLVLAVWWWWQSLARKRWVARVRTMVERGRDEIGGQSIEHCLDILNQNAPQALIASDAMVLKYKGREFFFVNGEITFVRPDRRTCWRCELLNRHFLVAVGQSAVRLLSEQEQLFGLIAGSSELAAFYVRRWSAFADMLMKDRK